MPTPPLPSRDDEPMTPPDVEPVVLWRWHPAYFIWRKNDPKASHAVEYRALPVAAYNALLARANTAKVAADLMRARAEKAERFLSMLFESHWDGTIGRPPTWHLRGDFRHILAGMRGETLEAAIEALGREGA